MDYATLLRYTVETEVKGLIAKSVATRRPIVRRIVGIETMAFPDGESVPAAEAIIRTRTARDAARKVSK